MINELKKIRKEELDKLYKEIISSRSINTYYLTRDMIVNLIATYPAPRFYITPKMAERYVLGYKRQDPSILKSRKLAMIEDLVEVYDRISRIKKRVLKAEIWRCVVESKAKSFYLEPYRIKEIIFNYSNRNGK